MRSLKARLLALWGLSLLSSVVLGVLLVGLYRQSNETRVERAQAVLARACDVIRDRYGFYVADWSGPAGGAVDARLRTDLQTVVMLALRRFDGVEGGIWAPDPGSLAYAYPTYEGSGPKTDLPSAEAEPIAAINVAAMRAERTVGRTIAARSQTLLLAACPLDGPIAGATGWTMTRVQTSGALRSMQGALLFLLALLLSTTVLLGRTLFVWGRHIRGIEAGLRQDGETLPDLPLPGERELDRVVGALNLAGRRLAEARREADALADGMARAERLAALGRMAAGLAHEIRNPIAAAQLQGENALAGDDRRRQDAIVDMLGQLARLDGLVSELLAMTQRGQPVPAPLDFHPFLDGVARAHAAAAAARGVTVRVAAPAVTVSLDPTIVARILDNLLTNAIRHAASAGVVTMTGDVTTGLLTLTVSDDGPGVPADMEARLFEPFVTGRADGTGLGLAIARELADAHGGRLLLRRHGGDGSLTDFTLELPQ